MKRRRAAGPPSESGGANWLTTFNDLVTLLMVFFVLLFSMSTIDTGKMKSFQESLQSGLGILAAGQAGTVGVFDDSRLPPVRETDGGETGTAATPVEDPVQAAAGDLRMLKGVSVTREERALRVRMEGGVLFAFGRADIDPAGKALLRRVAGVIGPLARAVRVEGHTDNAPIHTPAFPSNWELSTARAVNVVKYLINQGKIASRRLSAVGYGDSKPLGNNLTPQGRSRNRRVEIVLELEEESQHV